MRAQKRSHPPDPRLVAQRLDNMRRGAETQRAFRHAVAELAKDPVALAKMPLADVQALLTKREFQVCLLYLGGYAMPEIALKTGYSGRKSVYDLLQRAPVKRFIALVQAAQLERVIAGEFGVRAQAKAAAPRVLKRVIRKAGGEWDATGEPVGESEKDADAIRAADLVLTVAGEKEQPQEHLHKHLHLAFGDMTVEELEELGRSGKFPARYKALAERVAADDAE